MPELTGPYVRTRATHARPRTKFFCARLQAIYSEVKFGCTSFLAVSLYFLIMIVAFTAVVIGVIRRPKMLRELFRTPDSIRK